MSLPRLLLRLALGRRLPTTTGELRVPGVSAPVTIRRDKWGIPHIDAATDADAWFAVGFCHGQDRAGQLEVLWRVGRGRLAEWVGPGGLPVDRLSRRVGFRRSAEAQLPALAPHAREALDAYARGVTAGHSLGVPRKPHEFAILGGEPSAWDAADILATLKLQSFALPSNWDVELARLRLLQTDGPEAVAALDPVAVDPSPRSPPRNGEGESESPSPRRGGVGEGSALTALLADLAALQRVLPRGGGSNNWVIAGGRTTSGKPLLASDPHLGPTAPPPWYVAHVRTPDWEAVGAGLAGTPGFPIGRTGFAAWGVTAGLTDNADLFLETVGPDGAGVREADGTFAPCERRHELIKVKGKPDHVEDVLVTPRGPIITPLLNHPPGDFAVSLRAVWLDPLPVDGFLGVMRAGSFDEFRRHFADWPFLPLNVVYADAAGGTGWQLVGQLPRRKGGHGLAPRPADLAGSGWDGTVPFDDMPHAADPPAGFHATANNPPAGPFLGADYVDPYRVTVISEELAKRADWDPAGCRELQRDVRSKPWEEVRAAVLSLTPADPDARAALDLLRGWDGQVAADSAGACVFELAVAELCVRAAKAKAPNGWRYALGETALGADGHTLFADRRVGHLCRLLNEQPDGWFAGGWPAEVADVLGGVVRKLRREVGPGPAYWGWGHLRRLRLDHPLFGKHRLLGRVFNVGPVPVGGDGNTVSQAGARPLAPTDFTHNMANLRAVFDLADPAGATFVLAGGQSGNPLSPHHADQLPLWQAGDAVTPAWKAEDVIRQAVAVLRLLPG